MPDLTLLHLTDIHAADPSGPTWLGQDAGANLGRVVDTVKEMTIDVAAVLVSGDLVNEASEANYRAFNETAESLRSLGAPVYLALGNHDDRAMFRQYVLGVDGGSPAAPYYYSEQIGGLRLIVLDTGGGNGGTIGVDDEQLDWLERELAEPAPLGNLVVMHHPPLPTAVPALNARLDNVARLRSVLMDRQVRGILCGHVHFTNAGCFAGAVCATAPATVSLMDPSTQDGARHLAGSGLSLVHLQEGELIINPLYLPGPQTELAYNRHTD